MDEIVKIEHIKKSYNSTQGSLIEVFSDFSIQIPENRITAILGPSGCGKTTLLNILAGTTSCEDGKIYDAYDKPYIPESHTISYLFQEPRLLPWMNVEQNIDIVLRKVFVEKNFRQERVQKFLTIVGLEDSKQLYPNELSGGMRQRVAIARAFAYPSRLMLLDEPFQALDPAIRNEILTSFLRVWDKDPRTTLFVTHDRQEALLLADRVYILSDKPAKIKRMVDIQIDRSKREQMVVEMAEYDRDIYQALFLA